jgi:S-formylglutathione hydrolase FrmB
MGGYGGLTLGLRNPEMFVSIGSTSGAISHGRDAARRLRGEAPPRRAGAAAQRSPEEQAARDERARRPNPAIGIEGFSSQTERNPEGRPFLTAEEADAFDPFTLIHQVSPEQLPHIYLDAGTEDNLIRVAREFAMVLFENDIPFDFMQMPGAHNGAYWTQSVGHIMSIQYEVMRRALGERPVRQPRQAARPSRDR